jgi:hypothetical protein
MTVSPGQRLGPYEISKRIGAGGMGEVWKARDSRLERSVAIKILPSEFAQNTQRRLRFEREAKIISQLTHPHICTLYDIGVSKQGETDVYYLVMELIDGESLAHRLLRGPLPLPEVLRYGAQIAEALDRAHRAGIVHRDLKPANIMITRTGAKLLDFGIAKIAEGEAAGEDTVERPLTAEGTIVGTSHYMAPEQLEGAKVDPRTDLFAFGAVLYEMATGRRAFEETTKGSLFSAILREQPRPMSELQPVTPAAFEHVVSKCLAKDPQERWQTARDLADELRWIAEFGSQPTPGPAAVRSLSSRLPWIVVMVAGVIAILAVAAALRMRSGTKPRQVMRFSATIAAPRARDTYGVIAISPDGRDIVYSAAVGSSRLLYRRRTDQFEAKPVPGTDGALQPFFSPDGRWLGFFVRNKLMKIAVAGGRPIEIARATAPRGAEWLEDDTIVFCPFYYGGIERVRASGGTPEVVTKVNRAAGERSHRWPRALPGGKVILYSVGSGSSWDDSKVVAQRLDTGERKVVLEAGCDARYVPPGHLVYVRGTSLYAVPFDARKLEVRGQPVEVTTGVANHQAGGAEFAFSRDGNLVYFSPGIEGGDEGGRLSIVSRSGDPLEARLPSWFAITARFSPDGSSIAANRAGEIWSFDVKRGTSSRITTGVRASRPVWSSDASRVYYCSERSGPWQIYSRSADGSDQERRIVHAESTVPLAMSPDGTELLVRTDRKESGADIDIISLEGRSRSLVRSEWHDQPGGFSPDGRWVVYHSDESGRNEIYVRRTDGTGKRWQVSNDGGIEPRWPRQDEIIYLNGTKLMSAVVKTGPEFSAGVPQLLFERAISDFDVARDGRILLLEVPEPELSASRFNVVLNWFDEIRRR